jgi:tetratricopeptide (TPR) repeat protein
MHRSGRPFQIFPGRDRDLALTPPHENKRAPSPEPRIPARKRATEPPNYRATGAHVLSSVLVPLWLSLCFPAHAQTTDCGPTPYDCAVAQVQRHEFQAAIATLEQLIAKAPKDLKALNLLGIALTGAGRPEDAIARFRAALAIDPRFTPALKNLAVNEFTAGRVASAQQHFEEVLAQTPNDEIAHLHLGEIHFQRNAFTAALPYYEKSGARVTQNPLWILHYATCLLDQQRNADAVALLDRLPPSDPASLFDAGILLGRHEVRPEAARFFGAARRNGHRDAYAAGYNETLMLIEAGEHQSAIRVAEELFKQGVKPAELYNLVSRAYAKDNRIQEAYDALREATRLEPAATEHYIDLAMLCLEHKNYDLALEIVDIGLKHRMDSPTLSLQRGVVLAMKGANEQAEEEFGRAIRLAPDDPSGYVALAMVWMQRGETPKAVDLLRTHSRRAAERGKPQPALLYALGIALLRSGAAPDDAGGAEALQAFRSAVAVDPSFPQAQAELGKLLLKRGEVDDAIAHLEKAVSLEPETAAPAYVLAQAYRRAGQTDRARDLLARVSRLNAQERGDDPDTDLRRMMFRIVRVGATRSEPRASSGAKAGTVQPSSPPNSARTDPSVSVEAAAESAAACAAAGDLDGAIARLREAVRASPDSAQARYQLAVTLWNRYQHGRGRRLKADIDEAVSELSPAVQQESDNAQFHLVLGQLLAEQQQYGQAVQHIRRAMTLAPENAEYPYNLGLALRLEGNLEAAEAQFRAALAKNPDHALAHRSLGLVLRQKGDVTAAASELRRAATLQPQDAEAHHLLATVLLKRGDLPGAVEHLREATRLDSSLIEARVMLAQALTKSGQRDEALQQQAEVRRLNGEKADFGRMLVLLDSSAALLKKGDLAGAIAQRREAAAISPGFADAHYELGLALRDAGSFIEAEAALRQAIALDEHHARAHAALADVLDKRGDHDGARAARARAAALAPCSQAETTGTGEKARGATKSWSFDVSGTTSK